MGFGPSLFTYSKELIYFLTFQEDLKLEKTDQRGNWVSLLYTIQLHKQKTMLPDVNNKKEKQILNQRFKVCDLEQIETDS